MSKKGDRPKERRNDILASDGMIIQFILFELIQAFSHVRRIEEALNALPASEISDEACNSLIDTIFSSTGSLAGQSEKSMHIFTWNLNEGILSKTKNYCLYLANNQMPQEKDHLILLKNASRTWILCLKCLDVIREIQEQQDFEKSDIAPFLLVFKKMKEKLLSLAESAALIFTKFHDDENVILFLLMKKTQLEEIYQEGFLPDLIDKMFTGGREEAENFLSKKYSKRGFYHLLPIISQKFTEFEPVGV